MPRAAPGGPVNAGAAVWESPTIGTRGRGDHPGGHDRDRDPAGGPPRRPGRDEEEEREAEEAEAEEAEAAEAEEAEAEEAESEEAESEEKSAEMWSGLKKLLDDF